MMNIQWTDALADSAEEADDLREAKWQAARAKALSSAVYRQYDREQDEARGSAAGLVNGLAMVVLVIMGAVCLLAILWLCGAPWEGVW